MARQKTVLLVGDSVMQDRFVPWFTRDGVAVTSVEKFADTLAIAKKVRPRAIVFVAPRYWEDVPSFVTAARKIDHLSYVPIFYLGALVEGQDQVVLRQHGVKTITLGPVPDPEIVRFVVRAF